MTGFEELVERTRRELEGLAEGVARGPAGRQDLDAWREELRARRERFEVELESALAQIEGNAQPLVLDPDEASTGARRALGGLLRGLLRLGGLGKFLGSTQGRANRATLRALRLLQARVLEQDRALDELAAALRERDGGRRPADPPR